MSTCFFAVFFFARQCIDEWHHCWFVWCGYWLGSLVVVMSLQTVEARIDVLKCSRILVNVKTVQAEVSVYDIHP